MTQTEFQKKQAEYWDSVQVGLATDFANLQAHSVCPEEVESWMASQHKKKAKAKKKSKYM